VGARALQPRLRGLNVARPITGLDGCPAGWIGITLDLGCASIRHGIYLTDDLAEIAASAAAVTIDIPIGLTECGARVCDQAARRYLGRPRASSVFPAPVRAALHARDRLEASTLTRAADGRGVGIQAWNIYPRVREIDDLMRRSAQAREKMHECHPEVCFAAINGGRPMTHSKHQRQGLEQRLALIARVFGGAAFDAVRAAYPRSRVGDDDIADAFALCWSARRVALGESECLPPAPPRDAFGIPMRIVF